MLAKTQREHAVGVNQPAQFADAVAEYQRGADHFHARRRGAGAAPDKAGEYQQERNKTRPGRGVGAGQAGAGAERRHLERRVAGGFPGGFMNAENQQAAAHHQHVEEHQAEKETAFRVAHVGEQALAAPHREMQRETNTADQHEHGGDNVDGRAVPVRHGRIVGGEAAGGNSAETVANGIEHSHAGQPVGQRAGDGDGQVDVPQRLGGLGDARRQLGLLHRAGDFRLVQLHATNAQHRQDRHRQHDNAHAAQPLQLLAVEQH